MSARRRSTVSLSQEFPLDRRKLARVCGKSEAGCVAAATERETKGLLIPQQSREPGHVQGNAPRLIEASDVRLVGCLASVDADKADASSTLKPPGVCSTCHLPQ
jgi:hypothetical protein